MDVDVTKDRAAVAPATYGSPACSPCIVVRLCPRRTAAIATSRCHRTHTCTLSQMTPPRQFLKLFRRDPSLYVICT